MALDKVEVSFNPAGLQWLLSDPSSGVAKDLRRRVDAIVRAAKQNASGGTIDRSVVGVQYAGFGGAVITQGARGRFERSRAGEAFRNINQQSGGRGPNRKTSKLYNSIHGEVINEGGKLVGVVGTDVEYAYYLETGVAHSGNTFPFLTPALAAARD